MTDLINKAILRPGFRQILMPSTMSPWEMLSKRCFRVGSILSISRAVCWCQGRALNHRPDYRGLPLRFRLLIFTGLLLCGGFANANFSGVSVTLEDGDSDWKFSGEERNVSVNSLQLSFEESSETGLRVGVNIGISDLRVAADNIASTQKFETDFIGLYLRQPIELSEHFSLQGLFSYRYNTGNENHEDDSAEIEWYEIRFQLGLGARFSNFRITPFVSYYDVDGDISDDNGTEVFELDNPVSSGIQFDYFVENTAFVRLEFLSGDRAGGFLTFANQF